MRKTTAPLRMQFTFDGHKYSVTGHTQQQLHERYKKKLAELKEGHYDENTMVAKWADTWLETYKEGKVAPSTYNDYKMYVSLLIMPMTMGHGMLPQVWDWAAAPQQSLSSTAIF